MRKNYDTIIVVVMFIAGILLGRLVIERFNSEVHQEVREVLSNVIMLDVPPIDQAVSEFLTNNKYEHKYITAINVADSKYGVYEIENNAVKAYAHGHCVTTGDVEPGIYKVERTTSHLDEGGVRYWRVIDLTNDVYVTSPGYEIDDSPQKEINQEGFGNIIIDNSIMLDVYDNAEQDIVLLVIDEGRK